VCITVPYHHYTTAHPVAQPVSNLVAAHYCVPMESFKSTRNHGLRDLIKEIFTPGRDLRSSAETYERRSESNRVAPYATFITPTRRSDHNRLFEARGLLGGNALDKAGLLHQMMGNSVVAVIRARDAQEAVHTFQALQAGGVRCIEVALTTPSALDSIREMSAAARDCTLVGVGSVLDPESARASILAGARFVVSPTLNRDVISMCARYGVISVPGAFTPTEILSACEAGADVVKVFPARALGPSYIRDILAPMPNLKLMPTGGVGPANMKQYLEAGATLVGMGSELAGKQLIVERKWDEISARASVIVSSAAEIIRMR
jgi:2-dehydro-3-deoxyphosphogluconate aldolase/(4S)-4-hydroxy-2-oxoglutarate aldolase